MPFWSETKVEPKRKNRFVVSMGNSEGALSEWYIKGSGRPTFSVGEETHSFFNHDFKFPGRVEWDPLEITLVEPINVDAEAKMLKMIHKSGYNLPEKKEEAKISFTKKAAGEAIGHVKIKHLAGQADNVNSAAANPGVDKTPETYQLINPWISSFDPDELVHDDAGLSEVTLTFQFDYATVDHGGLSLADDPFSQG